MIGGTVIGVVRKAGLTLINVLGSGCERNDERAIEIVEDCSRIRRIMPGDAIWWQGRKAYWTPAEFKGMKMISGNDGGTISDIPLERAGSSH